MHLLELVRPPYSLLAALRLPFIIHTIFPPGRPRLRGLCGVGAGAPSPPLGSSRVSWVGWVGGENRFGYIAVFMVVLGTVRYLSRCHVAVRCQRGFYKHIGTGSYRFGQRYDTGLIGSGSSTA